MSAITRAAHRQRHLLTGLNWPLWLGLLLVSFVAFIALYGPSLAPRDPLQENYIVQNSQTGKFIKPPFAAFAMPGFPLGADQFGRDILSQLLWAVRPTLTLVLVVAALRLSVGTLVGLLSGWSAGNRGRALDALISAALAAPVMFVALCVIAGLGQRWGVWAFIVGLSLTGWAEAARLVREQTRGVKHQPFVEAARALGASDGQILTRHVLPQIMPLVWMLFSFEASSSLLTSAGLGFLGYFINSVWIPVGDWVGIRASGRPELGQMLASSVDAQRQPWGMLAAGGMVFLTVLGFNLLGEGLRWQMSLERLRREKNAASHALQTVSDYVEMRWFDPLSAWRRNTAMAFAIGMLGTILFGGGWLLWRAQFAPKAQTVIAVPGGHGWASELHDAQGTFQIEALGPTASPRLTWAYTDTADFVGGPVIAADGTLYVTAADQTLRALTPDGQLKWQAPLPGQPVGSPALGELGDVYVTGEESALWAITPAGQLRWEFKVERGGLTLSGPIVGPEGTIYFPTDAYIFAVTVDGVPRWQSPLPIYSYSSPLPRLDATGRYLFFENAILDADTGQTPFDTTSQPLDKYIVGGNGKIYLRQQADILEWAPTADGATLTTYASFQVRELGLGFRFPSESGVLADGRVWVYYGSSFEFSKLMWLDEQHAPLVPLDYPYRGIAARLIGLDGAATAYLCGVTATVGVRLNKIECRANRPGDNAPLWKLEFESKGKTLVGGAIAPERLYVLLSEGFLYAVEP